MTETPAVATGETSTPLDIPDAALYALGVANAANHSPRSYLTAVAAPVVATELRRIATQAFFEFRDDASSAQHTAALIRDLLRRRATELEELISGASR